MSSQWNNKYTIMRDLSLAQGRNVPATLNSTVAMNEKPPALNIKEDPEEDYFGHCLTVDENPIAPDLTLIQQMLELVRGEDVSPEYVEETEKVLEISKPNENVKGSDNIVEPKIINCNNNHIVIPKKKIKKKRQNVAVNSILEALASDMPILNMEKPNNEPLKLLKPNDFMFTDKEIVNSVEKVNGWLDSQIGDSIDVVNELIVDEYHVTLVNTNGTPVVKNEDKNEITNEATNVKPVTKLLNWEPSSMFKRRSGQTVKSVESNSIKSSSPQKVGATTASFRPSNLADEYYQKFVERSKMKALVKEDVWSRAERIMKELDKKKLEEVTTSQSEFEIMKSSPDNNLNTEGAVSGREYIQLAQHRHVLSGACAVCAALARRGFHIPDTTQATSHALI